MLETTNKKRRGLCERSTVNIQSESTQESQQPPTMAGFHCLIFWGVELVLLQVLSSHTCTSGSPQEAEKQAQLPTNKYLKLKSEISSKSTDKWLLIFFFSF